MVFNVSQSKARLFDLVVHGERVTIAKYNLPNVDFVPHR